MTENFNVYYFSNSYPQFVFELTILATSYGKSLIVFHKLNTSEFYNIKFVSFVSCGRHHSSLLEIFETFPVSFSLSKTKEKKGQTIP